MGRLGNLLRTSLALASLQGAADAFFRLPCRGSLGVRPVDPVVDFNKPSKHVHTLQGGNKLSLNTKPQDLKDSECSSCEVEEDNSAYWTPALYFMHKDGTAELVEQVGGMLAYYLLFTSANEKLVTFPPGFQMIAGDPNRRNFTCKVPEPPKSSWSGFEVSQDGLSQKALGFNCLHYESDGKGVTKPEASLGRHYLPDKKFLDSHCTSGIRIELFFPSCWDGKHATSEDHKSHMAYPSLVNGGDCPKSHPKRTASLFYETIWDTYQFKDKEGEFVLSNGDPTGFGYHGDFQFAWKGDTLEKALHTCTNPSGNTKDCPLFTLRSEADQKQCKMETPESIKHIECKKSKNGLPGKNPIERGPEPAKKHDEPSPAPVKEAQKPEHDSAPHYEKPAPKPDLEAPKQPEPKAKPQGQLNAKQKPDKVADAYGGGHEFANPGGPTPPPHPANKPHHGQDVYAAGADAAKEKDPAAHVDESKKQGKKEGKKGGKKEGKPVSTTTITSDGAIWHVAIEIETETVTAEVPEDTGAAKEQHYKRHLHQHAHMHAHQGFH
ncbi:MAG: hypothetical protein M1831_001359 [Alyxoria varia]|nr:MAG: hypothetical protein M1831_001359 [Alyxoria varia]